MEGVAEAPINQFLALCEVSRTVASHRTIPELLRNLAPPLRRVIDFDFVALLLDDAPRKTLQVHTVEKMYEVAAVFPSGTELPAKRSWAEWLRENQHLGVISHDHQKTHFAEAMQIVRGHDVKSLYLLPLSTANRLIGALGLGSGEPRTYASEELEFLSTLAGLVALAVDNTLKDEEAQQEQKRTQASLQASEGRWRRVFENSAVGVALTDREGRFETTNVAYQKLLGYTEEELRNLSFLDITSQEFREQNWKLVKELLERKRQQFNIEKQYRRKDGSLIWVRNNVSMVPGPDGAPRYIMAIVEDISERKRAESALQEAQAELAHVTRLSTMGEFAASIAHEVNQPLAAIVANGDACLRWLNAEPADLDEARESVKQVMRDANRAAEVIKGVRELAKKSALHLAPLSMNELIAEVLALARGEIQRNRVLLKTDLTPNLPFVLGDRVQLEQVLLNLILNGMEAMLGVAPGQRCLIVGTRAGEPDGVVVYVRDCGAGISAEVMQNIFKPFFTTKPGGTGVGLAISRSIVEAHHGRLWTTRNEERGMTFSFSVPAVRQ